MTAHDCPDHHWKTLIWTAVLLVPAYALWGFEKFIKKGD